MNVTGRALRVMARDQAESASFGLNERTLLVHAYARATIPSSPLLPEMS